ncbi:DUF5908 family protein [Paracoccus marinaquae]|uniref:Uncharacterized protein n=1 Tax=Paracoccus marinaquae TaxID=2841926 RepID=A0ABS6AJ35_9RHOB|nr:DUF5908 family protein [Paracoccus marinaquae]MBU3030117.1 hypothetical protein [Paracoccus marinaquae]
MAVEIGQLVLRATFGPAERQPAMAETEIEQALADLRRDLLAETREMIEDEARRRWER